MRKNKNAVASHIATMTTTGSVTTIVEAAAASRTLCASARQTMSSGLSTAARVVRRQASLSISSTRSYITRSALSTQRATTRCSSVHSSASLSKLHCQKHPRRRQTRRAMMMPRKTLTGSNNPKTWLTSSWRRSKLLQVCPEADTMGDSLSRTCNSETFKIQQGPHVLLQGGSMDQLL